MKLQLIIISLVGVLGTFAAAGCSNQSSSDNGKSGGASADAAGVGGGTTTNEGGTVNNTTGTVAVVTPPAVTQPAATIPDPGTTTAPTGTSSNAIGDLVTSIAAIFGAGGQNTTTAGPAVTPTVSGGTGLDDLRQDCLSVINQYRASIGRAPLTLRTSSSACLDGQSATDGASRRAHSAFGKCGESAQNVCPGWPGSPGTSQPSCLAMMWKEGPGGGHYENMANSAYKEVACGFAQVGNNYWMTQDFFR